MKSGMTDARQWHVAFAWNNGSETGLDRTIIHGAPPASDQDLRQLEEKIAIDHQLAVPPRITILSWQQLIYNG